MAPTMALNAKASPTAMIACEKPKLAPDQAEERRAFEQAGDGDQGKAEGQDQTGIDVLQQIHGEQTAEALGHANPEQDRPDLQGQKTLYVNPDNWV